MARHELVLKLDGALWLKIILKLLLNPKMAHKNPKMTPKRGSPSGGGRAANVCLGPVRHLYIY